MDDVAVLEADLGERAADLRAQLDAVTAENWPRNWSLRVDISTEAAC